MDPAIHKEMSSWAGNLKSEVDTKALELRTNSASMAMATVIRFKEDLKYQDKFGKTLKVVSGKLTEEQLMNIFTQARENGNASKEILAKEYHLSIDTITMLLNTGRVAILKTKKLAPSSKINELIVAV